MSNAFTRRILSDFEVIQAEDILTDKLTGAKYFVRTYSWCVGKTVNQLIEDGCSPYTVSRATIKGLALPN